MKSRESEDKTFPVPVMVEKEPGIAKVDLAQGWDHRVTPVFSDEDEAAAAGGFTEGAHPGRLYWELGDETTGRFRIERRHPAKGDVFVKDKRKYYAYKENKARVPKLDADGNQKMDENNNPVFEMKYNNSSYTTIHKDPDGKRKRYNSLTDAIKDCV